MDQDRKARLEAGGINIHGALERFMGNEAMLELSLIHISEPTRRS